MPARIAAVQGCLYGVNIFAGRGAVVFAGTPAQLRADGRMREEWLAV